MTTIAYKNGVMASDSCWTLGNAQVVSASKIHRLSSGGLLGQAGDNDQRSVAALFEKIKDPRKFPSRQELLGTVTEFHGLLALPRRGVWYIAICKTGPGGWVEDGEDCGIWEANRGFAAVGSGSDFAIGAMAAGKTAREAVAIACKFDINSRLPVHSAAISK